MCISHIKQLQCYLLRYNLCGYLQYQLITDLIIKNNLKFCLESLAIIDRFVPMPIPGIYTYV